ncbi:MAG: AmmeMemoRadiSam system protein A [Pyrinomonadaceae bacterium]|nr:AmmeMemoRadiSam system protein A [Pyrinomonadaceae bacterium]
MVECECSPDSIVSNGPRLLNELRPVALFIFPMGSESSLVFSGIAPHPPIMVPEVGREAVAEVRRSIDGMAELTKRLISSGAETVVLISPHAPLEPSAFVAYPGPVLRGNFANFSASAVRFEASLDDELLQAISKAAAREDYEVVGLASGQKLDHGTAVPLYFLQRNGWSGRVVALGYSFLSNEDHLRFGSCIGEAINEIGRSAGLIASGDLSHRLKPDAPAGYFPTAYIFDNEVVDALRANSPERIIHIDQELRRNAGECGYRSMLIALGATREGPWACEVIHYEAPFGVGYLVAQLTGKQPALQDCPKPLTAEADFGEEPFSAASVPHLARAAVETYVIRGTQIDSSQASAELLSVQAACFVSLKTHEGQLRGCIGTIEPAKETLAEEIIANAINAATRDPRFSPVAAEELSHLRYSVDVLSTPEPATLEDLDPAVYGVIVEDESGSYRGLLLPDLEGVDSVAKQVEIAARKAEVPPETPIKLSRFRVSRFGER